MSGKWDWAELGEEMGSSARYYENYGSIYGYDEDMYSDTYESGRSSKKSKKRKSYDYDFDDDYDDDDDDDDDYDFDDDDFDDDDDDEDWRRREEQEMFGDIKDKEERKEAIRIHRELMRQMEEKRRHEIYGL